MRTLLPTTLLASLLGACGGGSDTPAPKPPAANVSGTWQIQEEILSASSVCSGEIGAKQGYSISVTQSGNSITVKAPAGTFSGTLDGNRLSWRGSYPEDGGTTTITGMDITCTDTSLSGTTTWSWTDGSANCSGTTKVTGTKTGSAMLGGTVTIVPAEQFDDFAVVVRQSGTEDAPSVLEAVAGTGDTIVLPAGLWDIGIVPGHALDAGLALDDLALWRRSQRVVGGQNLVLLFD